MVSVFGPGDGDGLVVEPARRTIVAPRLSLGDRQRRGCERGRLGSRRPSRCRTATPRPRLPGPRRGAADREGALRAAGTGAGGVGRGARCGAGAGVGVVASRGRRWRGAGARGPDGAAGSRVTTGRRAWSDGGRVAAARVLPEAEAPGAETRDDDGVASRQLPAGFGAIRRPRRGPGWRRWSCPSTWNSTATVGPGRHGRGKVRSGRA